MIKKYQNKKQKYVSVIPPDKLHFKNNNELLVETEAFTTKQVSEKYPISMRQLEKWREKTREEGGGEDGKIYHGPMHIVIGHKIIYPKIYVDHFINKRVITTKNIRNYNEVRNVKTFN
tara:strand:- start:61 stop:414 length:354 start_codon:yes stop_codon:yes gene_type:complete